MSMVAKPMLQQTLSSMPPVDAPNQFGAYTDDFAQNGSIADLPDLSFIDFEDLLK